VRDARYFHVVTINLTNIAISAKVKMSETWLWGGSGEANVGQHIDEDEIPLAKRLQGLRNCLAHLREEALENGQRRVARHLAEACRDLCVEIERIQRSSMETDPVGHC
jgi:hypothetical protein